MKASEVYLRAAEIMADDDSVEWACSAIDHACGGYQAIGGRCQKEMRRLFYRRGHNQSSLFWMNTLDEVMTGINFRNSRRSRDIRSRRVLALLFMHYISLDEERAK